MIEHIKIDDVEIQLCDPDLIEDMNWIGGDVYMSQLLAAWMVLDSTNDIPMNPQILGKPGVGKTTLAYTAAKSLKKPVYIYQCTVDTRPEDLLISPIIAENNTIKYHASPLVSAMVKGGVCILDEANRMAEKSWASLAPLLDQRRYIESIIAGIKVHAHPEFRICVTMNDDSSTFEVPEYIHSRLQPQIFIEFPEREEEIKILQFNLPFAKENLITYTVEFLQRAHQTDKIYSIRDGINICRYYIKLTNYNHQKVKGQDKFTQKMKDFDINLFKQSINQILGKEALNYYENNSTNDGSQFKKRIQKFFKEKEDIKSNFDQNLKDFFNDEPEEEDDDEFKGNWDSLEDDEEFLDEDDFDPSLKDVDDPNTADFDYQQDDFLDIVEKKTKKKPEQEDSSNSKPKSDLSKQDPDKMISDFINKRKEQKEKQRKSKKFPER